MADVFDQIDAPSTGDVFDQVSTTQGDVFDKVEASPKSEHPYLAAAARIIPAVAGGVIGGIPGGAIGAGLGEGLAQYIEGQFKPGQIPLSVLLGTIPGIKGAETLSTLGRVGLRAGEGAALGLGQSVGSGLIEGKAPTGNELLRSMLLGGVFGGGAGAVESRLAGRAATRASSEVPPLPGSAPRPNIPEVPLGDVIPEGSVYQPQPGAPATEETLLEQLLKPRPKPAYEHTWVPDITTPNNEQNIYSDLHGRNRFNPEAAAEATANNKPYTGKFGTYDLAPDIPRVTSEDTSALEHIINMKRQYDPQDLIERSIERNRIDKVISEAAGERSTPGGANAIYPGQAPGYVGTKETQRVLADVRPNTIEGHAPGYVSNPLVERVSQRAGQRLAAGVEPATSVVANAPSALRTFWRSLAQNSSDMISSFGAAGTELSRRVNKAAFDAETMLTGMLHGPAGGLDVADKLKITPQESKNVTAVLEGLAAPMNERVRTLVNIVRPQLDRISRMSQDAGLEIRNMITGEVRPWEPRPNFVPHFTDFDQVLANPAAKVQAIQNIEAEARRMGKNLSAGEAEQILNQMRRNSRHEYGHLENARTINLSDYEQDFTKWYPRYLKGATERLAEAQQFGKDFSVADNLINMVGRETKSDWYQSLARQYFDRITGREITGGTMQGVNKFNEMMLPIQVITKLSHAVIANYTQRFYPAFMGGYSNMAKAWRQAISEQGQEFGRLAGASIQDTMRDIVEATMAGPASNRWAEAARKIGGGVLDITGFSRVEVMNRMIAANYGKVWAEDMLTKLPMAQGNAAETIKRNLRKLGIEPMEVLGRGGQLTRDEQIMAGRKMIELTQFKTGVKDLPLTWTNPLGRLLAQFSTFAFKSGKFTYDQVLREAKQGNFTPLMTFALSGAVLGEGVADIKSWIGNRDRPQNVAARMAENLAYIGSLGIWYDALQSAQYGEVGTARRLLGPTVSDINAVGAAALSGDPKAIARHLTQQIPIVGPYIRPRMFPPRSQGGSQ